MKRLENGWRIWILLLAVALPGGISAQTTINLRTQSKNVDFSNAPSTRPFTTGSVLPASCAVGDIFYDSSAPAGQNVYGCTGTNLWTLEGGGGSGGGASTASQLLDFQAIRNSSTNLLIGNSCSASTPCNVRVGGISYSFTSPASVNVSGGSGTLYLYVSNNGTLTAGSNVTAACASTCTAVSGITAFPPDAIPLFTWTVSSGTLNVGGGTDFRSFLSTSSVTAGTGLVSALSGGIPQLSVDSTLVMMQAAVPASSTTACSEGQWATDGSYFYLCISSNAWRRAGLSTW